MNKKPKRKSPRQSPWSNLQGRGLTKLNADIATNITNLIFSSGCYIETAAAYAGVARRTFYDWLLKGRRDLEDGKDTVHAKFSHMLDEASAKAEIADLSTISQHALGYMIEERREILGSDGTVKEVVTTRKFRRDWQPAAWRLARKHPERWGARIEAKIKIDMPAEFESALLAALEDHPEALSAVRSMMESLAGTSNGKVDETSRAR
jgi:hypothetical protein